MKTTDINRRQNSDPRRQAYHAVLFLTAVARCRSVMKRLPCHPFRPRGYISQGYLPLHTSKPYIPSLSSPPLRPTPLSLSRQALCLRPLSRDTRHHGSPRPPAWPDRHCVTVPELPYRDRVGAVPLVHRH